MDPKYLKGQLHFSLTEKEKFNLVKVVEECGELAQAACKVLIWGWLDWNPKVKPPMSNLVALEEEWRDLCGSMQRLENIKPEPALLGWFAIDLVPPPSKELILVMGPSGYIRHKTFVCAAYYDADYRPLSPWQSVMNDSLDDCGWCPTHWRTIKDLVPDSV